MARDNRLKPLYRKVNTRTHGVHHAPESGDFCHQRNTKAEKARQDTRGKMHGKTRHGLDYTPLYRFLISRVGDGWSDIHSQAVARLDREEPIWHLVARSPQEEEALVRLGPSSFFNGLFVDDDNCLQLVDPTLTVDKS